MDPLREIVALYLDISPDEIHESTQIGSRGIPKSIRRHRMYAKIISEGYEIAQPSRIETFGDLLSDLQGELIAVDSETEIVDEGAVTSGDVRSASHKRGELQYSVGIDVEEIGNLPDATEYLNHLFYTENFSYSEISFALATSDPKRRLAGLFSLKEAICKADNRFIHIPFKDLEISHSEAGAPTYEGFSLSNSYTELFAIGIAIRTGSIDRDRCSEEKSSVVALRVKVRKLWRAVFVGTCCIAVISVMTLVLILP